MKLSAPVYRLKREARLLSRREGVPLHEALDRIAVREGYARWSLLAAKLAGDAPAAKLYPHLRPGDLVLVGARPGHGKTMLCLELGAEAVRAGRRAVWFSLEYTEDECRRRLHETGTDQFELDCSDDVCADHIVRRLADAERGTLAVIDYLQLLDQKRDTPELSAQVRALREFAKERGVTLVFVSQIDRSFDPSKKPVPDLDDVRLPNPVDLRLFDKACFLNDGEVRFAATG